jgi:hypothetical protein
LARAQGDDWDGREVLTSDFDDPLDAMEFGHRIALAENRGTLC